MKILHAITAPGAGGAEVLVLDMAEVLVEQGHEVFILFLEDRGHDFEKYYLEKLDSLGVGYSFVGKASRKNPVEGAVKLRREVNKFHPDVVHCHNYYFAIFSFLSFCKTPRFVYTHHSISLGANRFLYKILDRKIDAYLGICQACYEMLDNVVNKRLVR